MTSQRTLATHYAEQMRHHAYGYAIYEPASSADLRPGSCGYFDESGGWTTIAQLDDVEELKREGFEPPTSLEAVEDKIKRSWHPKCSAGVAATELDLGIGIPETLNLPASARAALKYKSSSDFGAILMTKSPVEKKAYQHKSPFIDWVRANSKQLLQKRELEIMEHGLWIIRWTYSTKRASITAWGGTDKNVVIGFQASAFGTEFGPKGEWHKGRSDSSWDEYAPKNASERIVVMAGALLFRYSKHFWTDARLKEVKEKMSAPRSSHQISEPIALAWSNGRDALLCEEVGADNESEGEED